MLNYEFPLNFQCFEILEFFFNSNCFFDLLIDFQFFEVHIIENAINFNARAHS